MKKYQVSYGPMIFEADDEQHAVEQFLNAIGHSDIPETPIVELISPQLDKDKRYTDGSGVAMRWTGGFDEVWDEDAQEWVPDPEWAQMTYVGDYREFIVEVSELKELSDDVCSCGQIGCCAHS